MLKNCTYFFKGDKTPYTYKGLIEEFLKLKPNDISDIIFSKGAGESVLDKIYDKASDLQVEGFTKSNVSYVNGEPVISDNDSISCLEFIDSNEFSIVAKSYTLMSDEDYIKYATESFISEGLTEELALEKAKKEVEKWNTVGEDASNLHTLISNFNFNKKGKTEFQLKCKGTKFEAISGKLYDSLKTFRISTLGEIKARAGGDSKVIYNLNLKSELENIDKTLFGHIDMIVIDADGDLHLFNYKVTTTSILPKSAKLEKYRYQMALLKQMLASHGFKVKNATLNIVPIKVNYNEDYSDIESAIVSTKATEFTIKDGKYVFKKYDLVARQFIKSTLNTDSVTIDEIEEANRLLSLAFISRDVKANGLRHTAKEWIKKNRSAILDSNDPEYSYFIEFNGEVVKVKSPTKPENNSEILEAVEARLNTLDDEGLAFDNFYKDIKKGVTKGGTFTNSKRYQRAGYWLDLVFLKYFKRFKDKDSEWELIDNDIINSAGIILLRNKITHQLDILSLTDLDLTVLANFKKFNYIMGDHLNKSLLAENGLIAYKSTYGNIEAVRTMILLNQILPKLEGEFVLGKLHIMSLNSSGQGLPFSVELFNKECFSGVIKTLNKFPETNIKNNFSNFKYVDSFQVLLQEYEAVLQDIKVSDSEKQELIDTGFGALSQALTVDARINALHQVEQALIKSYPILGNIQKLRSLLNKAGDLKNPAKLYELVLKALQYYSVGEISSIEERISSVDRYGFVSDRVPNRNYQIVVNLYIKAINSISEQTMRKWDPLKKVFNDYYKAVGYTRLLNSTLGGQALIFLDLYRRTKEGKKLLRLLNPYDEHDMAQISKDRVAKQKFLKKVLFEIAKIRYPMKGIKFNYSSEEDPNLLDFISLHSDTYFNLPLESASSSTRHQTFSVKQRIERIKDLIHMAWTDKKRFAEELLNRMLSDEERAIRDSGIEAMQLYNPFSIGEGERSIRDNYIADKGEEFFETNLERLLIHFIESDILTKEYNKALVITKAILLKLDIMGIKDMNDTTVTDQTRLMIEDFTKVNVFNASIMEETSLKVLGMLTPLRRVVTDTLIGGNVIGGLRDTFEGVWQNMARTINKYQTNIDLKSLAKAYATVVKNSFTDKRSINIINLLCKIYRLSNVDVSRISEGLITEGGIMNARDWLYASLRRPDFLNRMVLFVAQCYLDGVYDAFDIKDGSLVYNWKKDERFSIYAKGDKNNPKYYEQMGAYYNAVRAYNLDHPNISINYNDDLPMPYSFLEIESFKTVAKSIYGAYDKSTRAMMDHMAIGTTFGMFSTWMNGIYSNYMAKPGVYLNGELTFRQAADEAGNLLFFDLEGNILVQIKDSNGNIKYFYEGTNTEVTNISNILPVMDKVPIIVLGIWYTLLDAGKVLLQGLKDGNVIGSFKENIWLDPMQRKNLDKLFTDLLAWLLFGTLYKFALTPAYKEFKKGMPERNIVTNAIVELNFKASSRSYDGFRGVYNVFEFLGENTNPPIYLLNIKLLKELGSVAFGKRSVTDALNGNIAIFKSFQDTWRAYNKSLK